MLTPYRIFQKLFRHYGHQQWWPAESPFEVMVGAVLTQNTTWKNVEKAIDNLKQKQLLNCKKIVSISEKKLASHLKPVGYFNVKARRLKNFCLWYQHINNTGKLSTDQLRQELLGINGVGPETADDILLYAYGRPVFVVDAYTRRLFQRLGFIDDQPGYEELRNWFEHNLRLNNDKVSLFNEFHALIVRHAKEHCRARAPLCEGCCLNSICEYNQ